MTARDLTPERIEAGLAWLAGQAADQRASADREPVPAVRRQIEALAAAYQHRYSGAWAAARSHLPNLDRKRGPIVPWIEACVAIDKELAPEERAAVAALDQAMKSPRDHERLDTCRRAVDLVGACRRIVRYGLDDEARMFSNWMPPARLAEAFARRGVFPLPGCRHVFEQRMPMVSARRRLDELDEQRAAQVAALLAVLPTEQEVATGEREPVAVG